MHLDDYRGGFPMNVLIVYCHPSNNSFTCKLKDAFIEGLTEAGHEYEISDLYDMKFQPTISESEYMFDSEGQQSAGHLSGDIAKEQIKIQTSDAVVFIFPMFWSASPAMLMGWFQRVMTKDFAYGDCAKMNKLQKACCMVTMADDSSTEHGLSHINALKATMINSKIFSNSEVNEFDVFDRLSSDKGDAYKKEYLEKARRLGKSF